MSSHQLKADDDDAVATSTAARLIRPTGMSVADLLSAPSESSMGTSADSPVTRTSYGGAIATTDSPSSRTLSKRPQVSPSLSSIQEQGHQVSSSVDSPSIRQQANTLETTTLTSGEGVAAYQYTSMKQIVNHRKNIEYKLRIREQPKHSRMCGIGEKADRRPIDPAPIIQLRVIVHDNPAPPDWPNKGKQKENHQQDDIRVMPSKCVNNLGSTDGKGAVASTTVSSSKGKKVIKRGIPVESSWGPGWEDKTWYLENPYYFMYAVLAHAETDEELHLLQDGKTRYTTGSCVSCLYHLKDIDGTQQGFFVFPDLSIRVEGRYRLKLCLFETVGHEVHHCASIFTTPFNVYTAKRFPGMDESTMLSKSFADQGLKVRVRKNPRIRRGRVSGSKRKDMLDSDDESDERIYTMESTGSQMIPQDIDPYPAVTKRARNEDLAGQVYPREQYLQDYDARIPMQRQVQYINPPPMASRVMEDTKVPLQIQGQYRASPSPPDQPYYPQREYNVEQRRESPFSRPPTNLQTPASELTSRQVQSRQIQQQYPPHQQQLHQEDYKARATQYPRHAMPPPVGESHYQARPELHRPLSDRDSRRSSPVRSIASRFEDQQRPPNINTGRVVYEQGFPPYQERSSFHFSTPSSSLQEHTVSRSIDTHQEHSRDRERPIQRYPEEHNQRGDAGRMTLPPLNVAFSSEQRSSQSYPNSGPFYPVSRPESYTTPASSLQNHLPPSSSQRGSPRLPSIPARREDHRRNNT